MNDKKVEGFRLVVEPSGQKKNRGGRSPFDRDRDRDRRRSHRRRR
jgi:hypothetical protein